MTIKSKHQVDLLRKRRESTSTQKITYTRTRRLKNRGLVFGLLISGLGLSICASTAFHTYGKIKYKENLVVESREYDLLKTKYNSILTNLKSIYKVNNQIAQGIIGTKSGSALLLELSDKLPTTIQLITIKSKGKDLTLNGRANQPSALSYINSLKLQLSDSFLIEDKSVFLSRAWETSNNKTRHLNFNLKTKFTSPSSDSLLANYERLGSIGLLKRVKLLKQEGLIK